MQITRFGDARRYDVPGHYDMRALRLQGFDASDSQFAWAGLSQFLPGGGAEMDASPLEKIYVVLEGEVTVELGDGTIEKLGKLDSCHIGGGVSRAVRNERNEIATMLVLMPYPESTRLEPASADPVNPRSADPERDNPESTHPELEK